MAFNRKTGLSGFAAVWSAAWLRPAAYRRGRRRLAAQWSRPQQADYFSQLAEMQDLPRDYRVLALAIVTHQRRLEALNRLVAVEAS